MTAVTRSITINIVAASPLGLIERQWVAVTSNTLNDVSGSSLGPTTGGTFMESTIAWTGACVDQDRKELIFPAAGGHMNYAGNQVFACRLSTAPQWYRLTDPSPQASVSPPVVSNGTVTSTGNDRAMQGHIPGGYAAMYQDGRMRALHHAHGPIFANGKVWFHTQSSPSGVGYSTSHAWSFDRLYPGIPTAPGGALPWANNSGPWTWLGTSENGAKLVSSVGETFGSFVPSAYDSFTGLIWTAHAPQAQRVWSSLNTANGTITRSNAVNASATSVNQSWAVVVYDPTGADRWRYLVMWGRDTQLLHLLNLKAADPYAAAAWSTASISNPALLSGQNSSGAVYHPTSKSILIGSPHILGNNVVKLRVPTDGTFAFTGGTWAASSITLGGAAINTGLRGDNFGPYSKFNILFNAEGGQDALISFNETNGPVWMCKLPATELT